jgi:hypothetical protein
MMTAHLQNCMPNKCFQQLGAACWEPYLRMGSLAYWTA